MTPETYRLLHVVGALLLFLGLGGVLAHAGGGGKPPGLFLGLHGLGLLVLLVCGVGVMHKAGYPWQPWVFAKIACWVLLAALPTLVRRGVLPRALGLLLVLGLGAAAAWLGLSKPF
ncbi:MAG: hypothetical protein JNL08_09085 [Planctomycetes bacterium]|nr:hypothetical protein [Planctomycetota bacterium]